MTRGTARPFRFGVIVEATQAGATGRVWADAARRTRTGSLLDDPAERLASSVTEKIGWVRAGAGTRFGAVEPSVVPPASARRLP